MIVEEEAKCRTEWSYHISLNNSVEAAIKEEVGCMTHYLDSVAWTTLKLQGGGLLVHKPQQAPCKPMQHIKSASSPENFGASDSTAFSINILCFVRFMVESMNFQVFFKTLYND